MVRLESLQSSPPLEPSWATICISDDGNGFLESELPFLFQRYFKGQSGNFGLGLAISQSVIQKHLGLITAQNGSSGAIFEIRLPTQKKEFS
jgi:two-component system, OmpR family, sensor histidine kinase CssS